MHTFELLSVFLHRSLKVQTTLLDDINLKLKAQANPQSRDQLSLLRLSSVGYPGVVFSVDD